MKFLTIVFLKFLLFSNFVIAETIPSKSEILEQSNKCFQDSQNQECRKLVSKIEIFQLVVFDKKKFKCQSSLLGLQSQLIEAYFFKNFSNKRTEFTIPYVVKNC